MEKTHILKTLETDHMVASILSDHTAMIRAMPGNYGIIIDREEDYSISPIPVFNILNNMTGLKALAIVTHRDHSATTTELDRALFEGELEVFNSVESAQEWINQVPGIAGT